MLFPWVKAALAAQALLSSLISITSAQQFQGEVVPNSLPSVPGSELTYWNIVDKKSRNMTLTNYFSLQENGQRLDTKQVKRAVVIIHGLQRDAGTYMSNLLSALSQIPQDQAQALGANKSTIQLMAPYFPNGEDKNFGYPWDYSQPKGSNANTSALVWKASGWASGENNQYPSGQIATSSYDCLDQIVQYFANKTIYPSLSQVVIAGHSLGAQTVQRYAAVGKDSTTLGLRTGFRVTYWVANPNSFVWLNSSRPLDYSNCPTYDDWRSGLSNYAVNMTYGTTLVNSNSSANPVLDRYNSRSIAYARGLQDMGDDSSNCEPFSTGQNRHERFFNFINWFPPICKDVNSTSCDTIDYMDLAHDGGAMMASPAGRQRIFIDNLNGGRDRAYNIGCPRLATNDQTFKDPACTTQVQPPSGIYSGMTYQGCYTDQSPATLSYQAFMNDGNSWDSCTGACKSKGYSIAGMEYGNQCFCGNSLTSKAMKTVDQGCAQPCYGNASQTCGNGYRLTVFATGPVTIDAKPVNPPIPGYTYMGCYTEVSGKHALGGDSYADGVNMTVENCANYCIGKGFSMFGTEYAQECYCGNSFTGATYNMTQQNCQMGCQGNKTEYCGDAGYYSLYAKNDTIPTMPNGTATATTAASIATNTAPVLSCPSSNGQYYTSSSNRTYLIECSTDHAGGDLAVTTANTLNDCIATCDATSGCVDVSFIGTACYMKSSVGPAVTNGVWGARLFTNSSSATASATMTSTSSSTAAGSTSTSTPLICPDSNGATFTSFTGAQFIIECGIDHASGDLAATSATTFNDCMNTCASISGCIDIAYTGNACYMKSTVGAAVNNGVWGARMLLNSTSVISSSAVSNSASATANQSVTSTASITAASATASTVSLSCPDSNNTIYTAPSGAQYIIECGIDHAGGDIGGAAFGGTTLVGCINACDGISTCVNVALSGPNCYPKSTVGAPVYNGVWGARKLTTASSSSSSVVPSSLSSFSMLPSLSSVPFNASSSVVSPSAVVSSSVSSSASRSASATPTSTPLSCPTADNSTYSDPTTGNQYLISCTTEYAGGDIGGASFTAPNFEGCIAACAKLSNCVTVSFTGGNACYPKSSVGAAMRNGVWSATLVTKGGVSSSSSVALSSSSSSVVSSSSVASNSSSMIVSSSVVASSSIVSSPSAVPSSSSVVSSSSTVRSSSVVSSSSAVPSSSSVAPSSSSVIPSSSAPASSSSSSMVLSSSVPASSSAIPSSSSAISSSSAPVSSSVASSSTSSLTSSSASATPTLPSGVSVYGASCYVDGAPRALPYQAYSNSSNTPALCAAACLAKGYVYAGTEYGSECWCGNVAPTNVAPTNAATSSTQCSSRCAGDATQKCGGGNRLSVTYNSNAPGLVARPSYGTWNLMSCYQDGVNGTRTLPQTLTSQAGGSAGMTVSKCLDACAAAGASYCGAEYYQECYGGAQPSSSLAISGDPISGGCSYACRGNSSEVCGGSNRILVYVNNGTSTKLF